MHLPINKAVSVSDNEQLPNLGTDADGTVTLKMTE